MWLRGFRDECIYLYLLAILDRQSSAGKGSVGNYEGSRGTEALLDLERVVTAEDPPLSPAVRLGAGEG